MVRFAGQRRPSKRRSLSVSLAEPDGAEFEDFSKESVDKLRADHLRVKPHATTLGGQPFLDTAYEQFLLSVRSYDPDKHSEFSDLIEHRLGIEIE